MANFKTCKNAYKTWNLANLPNIFSRIAMIAGFTMLKTLKDNPSIYKDLEDKTAYLHKGLDSVLNAANTPYVINRFGSMISVHFSDKPVNNFAAAAAANNALFNKFFHAMLENGVYLPPSAFETWFISNALSMKDIDETVDIAREALTKS